VLQNNLLLYEVRGFHNCESLDFGLLDCVTMYSLSGITNVLEEHAASIFRVEVDRQQVDTGFESCLQELHNCSLVDLRKPVVSLLVLP
jgi:hypothetical protein